MSTHSVTEAKLLYHSNPENGDRPYQKIVVDPVTGVPTLEQNVSSTAHQVTIENLRGKEDTVSLDEAGFQYFVFPSRVTSFTNDEEITREYYPESAEFIKKTTGGSRVHLFDHYIRRNGAFAPNPHVDQSPGGAIRRVGRLFPKESEQLLSKRFQIINLWRPIANPAFASPLTLCDYRTVNAEEDTYPMAFIDTRGTGYEGETLAVKFNEKHRWAYLYGMTPDEVVVFKNYDSKPGVAAFTPHSSFEDPLTPSDAPGRESIEVRALVFFDE